MPLSDAISGNKDCGTGCKRENKYDYKGYDIVGHTMIKVSGEADCANLCNANGICKFWTYWRKHCYLKTSNSGKMPLSDAISGNKDCGTGCKRETNYDYYGYDIPGQSRIKVFGEYGCASLCNRNPICKYWTYWTKHCYLKTSNSGEKYLSGANSGNKECGDVSQICVGRSDGYTCGASCWGYNCPQLKCCEGVCTKTYRGNRFRCPGQTTIEPTPTPTDITNPTTTPTTTGSCQGTTSEAQCGGKKDGTPCVKSCKAPDCKLAKCCNGCCKRGRVYDVECGGTMEGCVREMNFDYMGYDIEGMSGLIVSGEDACAALCHDYGQCKFWTFRMSSNHCWLKTSNFRKAQNIGHISGNRNCGSGCVREVNMDYRGYDIGGKSYIKVSGESKCALLCHEDSRCKFWTFRVTSKHCWLKTSSYGRGPNTGVISGSKHCGSGCIRELITDFWENDNDNDIGCKPHVKVSGLDESFALCQDNDRCKSWTFRVSSKHCWLKTSSSGTN